MYWKSLKWKFDHDCAFEVAMLYVSSSDIRPRCTDCLLG